MGIRLRLLRYQKPIHSVDEGLGELNCVSCLVCWGGPGVIVGLLALRLDLLN